MFNLKEEFADIAMEAEARLSKLKGILGLRSRGMLTEEEIAMIANKVGTGTFYHIHTITTPSKMMKMITDRTTIYDKQYVPGVNKKYGAIDKSQVLLGECTFGTYSSTFKYKADNSADKSKQHTNAQFNPTKPLVVKKEINNWTVSYDGNTYEPIMNAHHVKEIIYIYLPVGNIRK